MDFTQVSTGTTSKSAVHDKRMLLSVWGVMRWLVCGKVWLCCLVDILQDLHFEVHSCDCQTAGYDSVVLVAEAFLAAWSAVAPCLFHCLLGLQTNSGIFIGQLTL